MPRRARILAPSLLALSLLAAGPTFAAGLDIAIDQAARIGLGAPIRDVIVGDPAVASVTVMDSRHLMVVGKAYGVTNLMVTDQAGRTILNSEVAVGAPNADHISLYRGAQMSDWACSPRCEPQSAAAAAPTSGP
ncbi:MAG: pilus assembly protein N-terminal domain-containing protein [Caulobacteraceae bacterium]